MSQVTSHKSNVSFVFWGTDEFSVTVLETLKQSGVLPTLIITNPDKPKGRKLILTPPPAKVWAEENSIPCLQPEKLNSEFISQLSDVNCQMFLVASYGKIMPKEIIDLPTNKSLNIHPSLLPNLRGPAPIQETIIRNEKPAVTIMQMNEKMDQGPVIAQKEIDIENFPVSNVVLNKILAKEGAKLFLEIISDYLSENIKPTEQDDSKATYTKMIEKQDGLLNLDDDPQENYRKFLAYTPWPSVYFFKDDKRIKITDADLIDGKFVIKKIIPEGGKEITF